MRLLLSLTLAATTLAGCSSASHSAFLTMSEEELANYNASVSERDQIVCHEGVRRGTVGLIRKVCTSQVRMARLTSVSRNRELGISSGFYNSQSIIQDRGFVPQVFFSPPPPGYNTPIIHVLDNRH